MIPLLFRAASAIGLGGGSNSTALTQSIRSGMEQIGRGVGLSASLSINSTQLSNKLKRATDAKVEQAMKTALVEVRTLTPVRTGAARRGWKLEGKGANMRLVNNVPYIGCLNQGSSKQAPNGIIVPLQRIMKGKVK